MNTPELRLNPHLEAALQRIRTAAEQAAERGAEGLGMAALSAGQMKRRDALLSAQFLFRKQQARFNQSFQQSLRAHIAAAQSSKPSVPAQKQDWAELSLMDDDAVDALVVADRIGLAIGHQSEWELREVDAFTAGLAAGGSAERNPLRPELIALALIDAVNAVSEEAETRQILIDELTRALAQEMRSCYADIAELFRNRGLRPQDMRVRANDPYGGSSTRSPGMAAHSAEAEFDSAPRGPGSSSGAGYAAGASGYGRQEFAGNAASHTASRMASPGQMGAVDAQMMSLLRRLAQLPGAGQPDMGSGSGLGSGVGSGRSSYATPAAYGLAGNGQGWDEDFSDPAWQGAQPPNLIHQHREALRQASTGRLDHMVIDVVGSLFDQILSDPKVPPQMARLLARLQLPVLRAALGDPSFFSTRRHPVRRFINRLASLACAFEDFSEDPGLAFLAHVRQLVQDVANGDFDHMDVYERKLDELEAFIAEQSAQSLREQGDAAGLVERKEIALRLHQRYTLQLQTALTPVPMEDFLRDFLCQIWSQAILVSSRDGGGPERAQRIRRLGRDLVMSVQPKAGTAQRQAFLAQLPGLMRTLTDGMDLIAWPEAARKPFFGQLLPAHAESLKGQALSALEYNLLVKQLDAVFGVDPPEEEDLPSGAVLSASEDMDPRQGLTPAEAKQLGLVDEQAVDWNAQLDIDLGAEAPLQAADLSIEGLPAAEEAPEPSSGALLVDHLQLGFAYQMHTGDEWHKVKLAHISAGRSFFIFTQGHKHQQTVTMTARMLRKLCEAGRLRAFENAYLLERATARARKQLAALNTRS